jgi:phenylpyruvate tautomerase PptA (4-oxalocrotonate tautomerase family)
MDRGSQRGSRARQRRGRSFTDTRRQFQAMPTYTCWSEAGVISAQSREAIAGVLTEIHHEVAVAPRYFVQVIFTELTAGSLFLAGRPAPRGHVWIRVDLRTGRTAEQKRELLTRITTEVGKVLAIGPEHVWVYLSDIPGASVAEYGRPLPDPGGEAAWFAALPESLRQELSGLA